MIQAFRAAAERGAPIVAGAGKFLALPAVLGVVLIALGAVSTGLVLLSLLLIVLGEAVLALRQASAVAESPGDPLHLGDRGFWRCWMLLGLLPLWIALGFGTAGIAPLLGALAGLGLARYLVRRAGRLPRRPSWFRRN